VSNQLKLLAAEISTWKLFYQDDVSMYTIYMHPAKILARINTIFPVFADRYVQRQLQRRTALSAEIMVYPTYWMLI